MGQIFPNTSNPPCRHICAFLTPGTITTKKKKVTTALATGVFSSLGLWNLSLENLVKPAIPVNKGKQRERGEDSVRGLKPARAQPSSPWPSFQATPDRSLHVRLPRDLVSKTTSHSALLQKKFRPYSSLIFIR